MPEISTHKSQPKPTRTVVKFSEEEVMTALRYWYTQFYKKPLPHGREFLVGLEYRLTPYDKQSVKLVIEEE